MPDFDSNTDTEDLIGTKALDGFRGLSLAAIRGVLPLGRAEPFVPGPDDDLIFGTSENDRLSGGAGHDQISAGDTGPDARADDVMFGGTGNDTLIAAGGKDRLFGGRGIDTLRLGAADWVDFDIDLAADSWVIDAGAYGRMVIDGFEHVFSANGDDTVRGSAARNEIDAGGGHDLVFGRGGADVILDRSGNDTVHGGAGDDTLRHDHVGLTADLDLFFGGAGRDSFVFSDVGKSAVNTPDTIGDFARGQDKIDLSDLRGPGSVIVTPGGTFVIAGDLLDLTFLAREGFSGDGRAELRVARNRFEVDWDGDGTADMAVALTGAGYLARQDFLLG